MNTKKMKEILAYEWEGKKTFNATWGAACSVCGADIEQDDPFYFYGEKLKLCQTCFEEIDDWLQGEV